MDHIIRRQLLELTLDGRQPPFDLQNRLSDQYYQTLLPVLEKWFDQLAGDDEVLFIDRLVLDLGEFSRRDFDDRLLKQRLIEKLSSPDITRTMGVEALSATAGQGSAPGGGGPGAGSSGPGARSGGPGARGGGSGGSSHGGAIQRRSARHNAFEQWIWYMEKGYLPWSLLRVTPEWEHKVLETLATDYPAITRVRSLLTNRPATLTRIAQQHDDIFLMRLTEILTTVVQSPLPQTLQELRRLLIYAVNLETVEYQPGLMIPTPEKAWQDALMLAASLGKDGSTPTLAVRLLTHYWSDYPKFLPDLQEYLTTHPIARDIVDEAAPSPTPTTSPSISASASASASISAELPQLRPEAERPPVPGSPQVVAGAKADEGSTGVQPAGGEQVVMPASGLLPGEPDRVVAGVEPGSPAATVPPVISSLPVDAATGTIPVKAVLVPPVIPAHLSIEQLPEEGLFLLNAGVILTHPFLNHLFKTSGLLVSGKFIADEARQKAIHLLHYLATGRTVAGEFELTAAKVLCGCPLEYPVEKQSVITPEELNEADSLLEGLIAHWGVRNITVEGLRGNFLCRGGKLSPKNDKLQLVIEKHAVDILVRTYPFPWNMSIIKLPWLKQAIHLDW